MAEETFNYYVVFAFVNSDDRLRMTCRYIHRDKPIETADDVESLKSEGVFGRFSAVTVINWKRIQ